MNWRPVGAAAVLVASGCSGAAPTHPEQPVSIAPAAWAEAHQSLEALRMTWRAQEGTTPVVARFAGADGIEALEGRGALAVRKPDSIRMTVVTAGGPTAFDLWIRGEQFRMAMPLRDRVVRGRDGVGAAQGSNLPVGFLRWWLLSPLQGRLTAAYVDGGTRRWVLQDDRAAYDVRQSKADALTIIRRGDGATEQLEVERPSCPRAEYRNARIGLQVVIACDPSGERSEGASDRAFEDPDSTRR